MKINGEMRCLWRAVDHHLAHNRFNQEHRLISRDLYRERRSAALAEWRAVMGQGPVGVEAIAPNWRQVELGLAATCGAGWPTTRFRRFSVLSNPCPEPGRARSSNLNSRPCWASDISAKCVVPRER